LIARLNLPIHFPVWLGYDGDMPRVSPWQVSSLALVLALTMFEGKASAQTPPVVQELDPESPLSPMEDIGVAWPTLDKDETSAATDTATPDAEQRYSVRIEGLAADEQAEIDARFAALSALKAGEKNPVNVAQLDRRAREDGDLLASLLRSRGYYDADIETRVEPDGAGRLVVRLIADTGPRYTFDTVAVAGLEGAGAKEEALRSAFAVDAADPVDAEDVLTGKAELESVLARSGFPFAKVSEPDVVVDHDTGSATLAMKVDTGGERRFGGFIVKGDKPPFGAKHLGTIARFKPGQPYDAAQIEDLRRAVIATSLVSTADIAPVEGSAPGTADIAVTLEPAPYRTISGSAGYDTGEGIRAEASWTHRNFLQPEGAFTLRGVLGTREQQAGASLRMSNFRRRDQALNLRIAASNINQTAYDARTFELGGSIERLSNIIWQKQWTWTAGFELLASDERDIVAKGVVGSRKTYFIGALPMMLSYDGSDSLLDPTRGFRLAARLSPEVSLQSGTFGYAKVQLDGSAYIPMSEKITLAGRVRLGTIAGAARDSVAPSRRFYAGGGGSVRGYGYQMIGPTDVAGDPLGGKSLGEFGLEARVRTGLLDNSISVVPFLDGGTVSDKKIADFKQFRFGAGLGVRYHSSFGPIRIDVGTPINRQAGDSRVTVFVSLGQAF